MNTSISKSVNIFTMSDHSITIVVNTLKIARNKVESSRRQYDFVNTERVKGIDRLLKHSKEASYNFRADKDGLYMSVEFQPKVL